MNLTKATTNSVFAVAFWGFTALLLTGELNLALVLTCYGLLAVAYGLRSSSFRLSNTMLNILTLGAFVAAISVAIRSLFDATVYFFMYLQLAKLFSRRTNTDTLWVYVIAFFQILGAAILTSSIGFAFIFTIYILLMTGSLILFTIQNEHDTAQSLNAQLRQKQAAELPASPSKAEPALFPPTESHAQLPHRAFLFGTGVMTVAIFLTSAGFFLTIPRLSAQQIFQQFSSPGRREQLSAFGESVEFGSFQKIQLDPAVAMYVRPQDGNKISHLRLRGSALDTFDGKRWRRTTHQTPRAMPFEVFSVRRYPNSQYLVMQPPNITNFFFGDSFPESLRLEQPLRIAFDSISNVAYLPQPLTKELHYWVISRVEQLEERQDPETLPHPTGLYEFSSNPSTPLPRLQRSIDQVQHLLESVSSQAGISLTSSPKPNITERSGFNYWNRLALMPSYRSRCLALPSTINTKRLQSLAQLWTKDATTSYAKARAIEERLRNNYAYSLEHRVQGEYIEDFLFRSRSGHCEYFATSMAVLLRTLGIPARIVNGFYSTEWNDMASVFTVRQRDAHSWVEVYFDNYGWMTFDPTPPSGLTRADAQSQIVQLLCFFVDAMKVRWYRYIVDYSWHDQVTIVRTAVAVSSGLLERLHKLSQWIGSAGIGGPSGQTQALFWLANLFFFSAVIALFLWRLIVMRLHKHRAKKGSTQSLVRFYSEVLRQLQSWGFRRTPAETPREFALRVGQEPQLKAFCEITEYYYRCRFLGTPLAPAQIQAVEQFQLLLRDRRKESNNSTRRR